MSSLAALTHLTLTETAALLQQKVISAAELTSAYLLQIEKKEPVIGAYLSVFAEKALSQANTIDSARLHGDAVSPLSGIPYAAKDNICTAFGSTTCASNMLAAYHSPYSAKVIESLEKQGCILFGKTNLDEFAMGSTTQNSAFQITRNPRNPSCVPGGSSGGSAAAVAADEALFSLGSDTGGSVRQPAAFCGVVGMKPTYGRVSRYGLVAFASSFDQIGPITKNVSDCALVMDTICGTAAPTNFSRSISHSESLHGLRIGIPTQLMDNRIAPDVRAAVYTAASSLEKLGAVVSEFSLPSLSQSLSSYYIISSAEASSNLSRFDGIRFGSRTNHTRTISELYERSRSEGFGAEVKRRIMLGTFVLSAGFGDDYYKKALTLREKLKNDFANQFNHYDLLLSPTAPTSAYRLDQKWNDPLEMYLGDICTVPMSLAGLPALSLPCGENVNGLPLAIQLTGNHFCETELLRCAAVLESELGCYHTGKENPAL